MSTQLATALAVLYFVAILAFLYYTFHVLCRALLFLSFPYPQSVTVSGSSKVRSGQWRRFLSQISNPKPNECDSDSNNELNSQKKALSPTTFVDWFKCLFLRYHPIGTVVYSFSNSRTLPISATFSLLLTALSHSLIVILSVLIIYWTDSTTSPLELPHWLPIGIPCSAAVTTSKPICHMVLLSALAPANIEIIVSYD
jgi:hypothetical protein